jgi:hypothetical protein
MTLPLSRASAGSVEDATASHALKSRRFRPVVIAFLSVATAFALLGVQLKADLWIIDDHALIGYAQLLGRDRGPAAAVLRVPGVLAGHPEFGQWGVGKRYRPVFVGYRVLGVALWGLNPHAWYVASTLMFAAFLTGMAWVLDRLTGGVIAALMLAYLLTHEYWGDVWGRLAPSEQYASVGVGLFLVGSYLAVERLRAPLGGLGAAAYLLAVGSMIAMGSKENFIIMMVPLILLTTYAGYRGRLELRTALPLGLAIVSGVVMAGAIAVALKSGTDAYGHSAGLGYRLAIALGAVWGLGLRVGLAALVAVPVLLGVGVAIRRLRGPQGAHAYRRHLGLAAMIGALVLLLLVWEYTFYNGQWPTGTRYDFPGRTLEVLVYALMFCFVRELALALRLPSWLLGAGFAATVVGLAVLIAAGDLVAHRRAILGQAPRTELTVFKGLPIHNAASLNTARTLRFNASLDAMAAATSGRERWPIVIESYDPWDWEPVQGLHRFLSLHHIANPLYLRLHGYPDPSRPDDFAQRVLGAELLQLSETGQRAGLQPLSMLDAAVSQAGGHCFSVSFSGPPVPACTPLTMSWR